MYKITFSKEAVKHVLLLQKSSPQAYQKLATIIEELAEHPYTGSGHPEQLKYITGMWSRHLDKENRLIYTVNEGIVTVFIIAAIGHYSDK